MANCPNLILVMRHAEKPENPSDVNLSPAGYKRADRLAEYIPNTFETPGSIFAAATSKQSARPYQTVHPLSDRVHVPIDANIPDHDYSSLANMLLASTAYKGQLVVVCWHHANIPALLRSLGAKAGQYPDPWPPNVFNKIVQLDFSLGAPATSTVQEPF